MDKSSIERAFRERWPDCQFQWGVGDKSVSVLFRMAHEGSPTDWAGGMVAQLQAARGVIPYPDTYASAAAHTRDVTGSIMFDLRKTLDEIAADRKEQRP